MLRTRPRARWILATLAAALVAAGFAVWARFLRVSDLEEALVREANETIGAPHPRPVHVAAATPGAFADALARHLPAIEQEARRWHGRMDVFEHLRAAGAGTEPLEALPPEYHEALAAIGADLRGLLAGTHAERAELALGSDPTMPARDATWAGYSFAAWLVAVEVRGALAAGNRERAAELCLDGLALGRDAAVAGGLIGAMLRGAVNAILFPACASALATSGTDADALRSRLRSIRDAVPGFEAVVRRQAAEIQLLVYGSQLPPERRAQLRPRPAALAGSEEAPTRWSEVLARRIAWRDIAHSWAELGRAAALRGDARRRELELLAQRWRSSLRLEAKVLAARIPDFLRFALRDDHAALRLDVLVCATAARAHRTAAKAWPSTLDVLVREGLLQPGEAERLRDLELVPDATGALTLRLPLPEIPGTERETVSARLDP